MDVPALEVRSLAKDYARSPFRRPRTALAGIDLTLARGESLGLLGPNGSGKSTLLALLAGVERASRGSIRVFGASLAEGSTRRRIGHVPDAFPFPGELDARTVLEILGSLYGLARAERRRGASELLERVGLAGEARTRLASFSLGMKRRFALCQAWLHGPDLLLLDEPSAGLDAPGVLVLEELLDEARARGVTLVLASHVAADVLEHCGHACVLVDGRIVANGAPAALLGDRARLLAYYRATAGSSRVGS